MRAGRAMGAGQLVSPEVLARVHSEQLGLLLRLEELRGEARAVGAAALAERLAELAESLRMHAGLVDAVIEALMPDVPDPPVPVRRPRRSRA